MTTFGITDEGFTLKRLADILATTTAALSTVVDAVSGESLTPDLTDENDPLVQIVNSFCDSISVCWEQLQLAYNQFDPLKATGAGLSGLVQLNGLTRQLGGYATAAFDVTGTANKTILAGKQVADINSTIVFALPEFTLDGDGEATVTGTCTVKGPLVALTGSVFNILTPTAGLLTAVNTNDSSGGSDDETDAELRARQQLSTSGTAHSVIDSVYSVLGGITGVTMVRVYQNNTLDDPDTRSIPAKSIAVVIMGGADLAIAIALFRVIPLGVGLYGTTTVTQTDAQGVEYPIAFTRPAEIDVFVLVDLDIVISGLWTDESEDDIKAAIVAWSLLGASGVGIDSGYDRDGYLPGDAVYSSELYVPVNKQLGIKINSITVGITNPATEDSVVIDWNEIAVFDSTNITVTYGGSS